MRLNNHPSPGLALLLAMVLSSCAPGVPSVPPTATVAPTATLAPTPTVDRVAAWRADLQALSKAMVKEHPDLFWRTDQAAFEALVADLDRRIPELSDAAIVVELSRIVSVADGHSFLPLFQPAVAFHLYPLRFYQFSDGLYIVEADAAHQDLVGARVTQIGGQAVADAYAAAAPLVPYDNDQTVALLVPVYLNVPEVLLALGLISDAAHPGFGLEMPDGTQRTVDLAPIESDAYRNWLDTHLVLAGLPQAPEPLYLSRKNDEFYWYTLLEDGETVYIQYNLVMDATQSGQNIYAFADEIDEFVQTHAIQRTIVDVRHNLGGKNFGPLARMLAESERVNQPGRLLVLIGRQTFSAAMKFVLELERTTEAQFVGEPTGARPNFYANQATVTLPNSGIEALISTEYEQASSADDSRLWLEPDLPVALTSADFFAQRDPVLEAALAANIP
jgi:hypothetical protein